MLKESDILSVISSVERLDLINHTEERGKCQEKLEQFSITSKKSPKSLELLSTLVTTTYEAMKSPLKI
jgi:hypothetical protein